VPDTERQTRSRRFEEAIFVTPPASDVDSEGVVDLVDPDPQKLSAVPRPLTDGDRESWQ